MEQTNKTDNQYSYSMNVIICLNFVNITFIFFCYYVELLDYGMIHFIYSLILVLYYFWFFAEVMNL